MMSYKFDQPEIGYAEMNGVVGRGNTAIADIFGNGFFIVDQQWKVSLWNNIAEKLLGISADDMIGKNIWVQFKSTMPEGFYTSYHQALLEGIPAEFSVYWEKMNAWFDVTTCYFDHCLSVSFKGRPDGGNPAPSVRQLKSTNDMYRLVTEVTSDCLWEWDLVLGQILWIDGGHKRAFGYPIENALIPRRFWESRLHPDDRARVVTSLHDFFVSGMAVNWEEEYRFRKFNGDYAYVHDRGQIVYNGEKKTSLMIGATQDISARKLAESEMHRAEADLARQLLDNQKQIFAAILAAREKDRNLIGMELHDNVNQILAATKMLLSVAMSDVTSVNECLAPAIDNIQNAIDETRRIAHQLVAPDFEGADLAAMVRDLSRNMLEIAGIDVYVHTDELNDELLDSGLKHSAYRIAQEQFTNIIKYAHAKVVNVLLSTSSGQFKMSIADDGVGMVKGNTISGIGLNNVRDRVSALHGETIVSGSEGEGFTLEISVPLRKAG